jgi:hypothetical protein
MLSEAKHLGSSLFVNPNCYSEIESLASGTSSAALQLRFAQNDKLPLAKECLPLVTDEEAF